MKSHWAKIVSDVISPPVVWAILAFPVAGRNAPTPADALAWALIYVIFVSGFPLLYILLQVRRGNITDMHMPKREERMRPFVISWVACLAASILLFMVHASNIMLMFTLSTLIQITLMSLITALWQISIHAVSISGAVITVGTLFGAVAALLITPLIPIVGLARLNLHRHTRAQVIAGVIVGFISVSAVLATVGLIQPGIWGQK